MMSPATAPAAMALIEIERRRDRFIRRANIIAWSVSLSLVLLIAIVVAIQASQFLAGALEGEVPWSVVIGSTVPLIDMLWKMSLLVVTLTTIAIFMRLRTASLAEIQLRLAGLEEIVAAQGRDSSAEKD